MSQLTHIFRLQVALSVMLVLVIGLGVTPAFAAAPTKEKVKYLGNGKVEVDFRQDVNYKKTKVSVKDTSGNTYKVSIYERDDDELKFRIKNYKAGKTYNFTITGIRAEHTSKYGKVTGKVKIPKVDSNAKNITAKEARDIALKDADVELSDVYDLEVEKDRDGGEVKYEVSFKAGGWEYDYEISLKGKILWKEKERDDDFYDDYDDDGYDDYYDEAV